MGEGTVRWTRGAGLGVVAAALVVGVAAARLGGGVLFVLAGAAAAVAVFRRPVEGAVLLGLASPLDYLGVLQTPWLDLRFLEVLWLVALARVAIGALVRRPVALVRPPRALERLLVVQVGMRNVLASVLGGAGFASFRETAQLAGFAVMLWLFAASWSALPEGKLRRYVRGAVAVAAVLVGLSLAEYALGLNLPYTIHVTWAARSSSSRAISSTRRQASPRSTS